MTIRRTYLVGESPEPQTMEINLETSGDFDLTGYTAQLRWRVLPNGTQTTSTATVSSPATGIVSFSWPSAMFTAAQRIGANVRVTNGTVTIGSEDVILSVREGAGGTMA